MKALLDFKRASSSLLLLLQPKEEFETQKYMSDTEEQSEPNAA